MEPFYYTAQCSVCKHNIISLTPSQAIAAMSIHFEETATDSSHWHFGETIYVTVSRWNGSTFRFNSATDKPLVWVENK